MKKVLLFAMLVFATGLLFSCKSDDPDSGGHTYKTVKIGEQTWMAENLNYAVEGRGSKCYYNLDSYCDIYGRLYDWSTAMDLPSSCNRNSCSSQIQPKHRGICPSGWHIPSNDDWNKLFRYVDSISGTPSPYDSSIASKYLKSLLAKGKVFPYGSLTAGKYLKATSGWNETSLDEDGNGTDQYGFSALPGGFDYEIGTYDVVGYYGKWWSASEDSSDSSDRAYTRRMSFYSDQADWGDIDKFLLLSVRCLKD
jgi:uncharacterized protein (TIGR02145 family)